MNNMICIPFELEGKEYYSIVRFVKMKECTEVKVTIMNGYLERALYGNNILQLKNGYLIADLPSDESECAKIKRGIINALDKYLAEQHEAATL